MAALNGGLGTRLQSPLLAVTILFAVGGMVTFCCLVVSGGSHKMKVIQQVDSISAYLYLGGLFVAFYIFAISWMVPKIGVGSAVSFVLLGQLISMAVIDHFGLLGAPQYSVSPIRLAGLALMTVGIYLVVRRGSA